MSRRVYTRNKLIESSPVVAQFDRIVRTGRAENAEAELRRIGGVLFGEGGYRRACAERAVGAMLSFDGLQALAEQWLEHYPADVMLVCDPNSPDPGPRLAAALRDCLGARA